MEKRTSKELNDNLYYSYLKTKMNPLEKICEYLVSTTYATVDRYQALVGGFQALLNGHLNRGRMILIFNAEVDIGKSGCTVFSSAQAVKGGLGFGGQ